MSTCPGLGANTDVNGKLNQFCKAYLKKWNRYAIYAVVFKLADPIGGQVE